MNMTSRPSEKTGQPNDAPSGATPSTTTIDMLITGAGFAGMYMLIRARELGLSARVIEAGADVGGTWYWNRYPGARCDIESLEYSYGFDEALQQEWRWSERFAPQAEILAYARHVAERYDLKRDITFGARVVRAWYDEVSGTWSVGTEPALAGGGGLSAGSAGVAGAAGAAGATNGTATRADTPRAYRARFVVMATGCLSSANLPAIKGIDSFTGPRYHTGQWPHEPVPITPTRLPLKSTGPCGHCPV